jgi:uncharacterized protein DUF3311
MSTQTPDPNRHEGIADEGVDLAANRRVNRSPWNWLLVLPFVATLLPFIYNRTDPTLAGIPFFYWYQMACIAIGVATTLIVYRATRGER